MNIESYVKELIGQTLKEVKRVRNEEKNEEIIFITKEDEKYKPYHEQDCRKITE